ncbi:TonB-dependent receptor [Frigoriflavimonas asaccharolytica]|uniref:Carboxypeptidase-like protein n=1 Tax=Frigoriflavimonas asaccharolytica TaxID=2735899 RepID=A0A8J8K955_9FLAO|nr:TonB-dependent receptor [Frigoriflavimonas asaccharolytica]NRS92702.1 hypothetical protein [Frigoriflavimonas asaccharolytica]
MRIILFIFLFFSQILSAQTQIKGIVQSDSANVSLKANIILLNEKNEIETFGFTNKDGSFLLNVERLGKYTIQITAFNYNEKKIDLFVNEKDKTYDLGNINISHLKEYEIKEVVITRDKPIRITKDTIEYKASKFANGTEMNVEDLLKKLPGMKVGKDGRITFGDTDVEVVLIENDDLFERGYQTLTQNMPANALEKVQVIKNYSKNKLLKNIQNTESIAINLTIKEDAKGKWFGSTTLASTTYDTNFYQVKFNLMNFTKRKKIYLLYNQNNLGLNEMSGVQYLMNPSSDKDVENLGGNINLISLINLHQKNNLFEDNRTNFNNDKLVSLNYINNYKNDWKLKFVTVFNDIENRNFVNSLYKFNFEGLNFTNVESNTWKQSNQNVIAKVEILKDFKNDASLQFYNKLSWLKENNDNDFIFNNKINNQNGENKLFASENKVVYTKKLDSTQAIVAVGKFMYQNRPYQFTDENDVFKFILNNPAARKIQQNVDSNMQFGGAKLSYLNTIAKDKTLEIQIGNEYRTDHLNSQLNVFDAINQAILFDKNPYENLVDFTQNKAFSEAKYNFKNDKWSYGFGLISQYISANLNEKNTNLFNISPILNIGFKTKHSGNFNINASRRISQTGVENFYQNFIYQGNRSFRQSEVGFQNLPAYNVGFSYNLGDEISRKFNFNINYSRQEDYISNNTIVNPNYTFNQNILIKNNDNLNGSFETRRYFKFIKSRISLLGNYNYSRYENSVNSQALIATQFQNIKLGFEMKSGWTKKINYELGYDWAFNIIKSDVNNTEYLDQKGFANLYYNFSEVLRLESIFEYYKFGNAQQKTTNFWDIKFNYQVKKHAFNIFINANNLLNNKSIQRFSISNISESLYTQRLLPRHVVLGVNKNF